MSLVSRGPETLSNMPTQDSITITPDKVLVFHPKSRYISYFSMKTYVVVLIRNASLDTSNEYIQYVFSRRSKENIMLISGLGEIRVFPKFNGIYISELITICYTHPHLFMIFLLHVVYNVTSVFKCICFFEDRHIMGLHHISAGTVHHLILWKIL